MPGGRGPGCDPRHLAGLRAAPRWVRKAAGAAQRPALGAGAQSVLRPSRHSGFIRPTRSPGAGCHPGQAERPISHSPPTARWAAAPHSHLKQEWGSPAGRRRRPRPPSATLLMTLVSNVKRTDRETRCPARACTAVCAQVPPGPGWPGTLPRAEREWEGTLGAC